MAQYTERLWTQTKDTEQLTFIAGVDLPYRELVKESGPNTNIMVVATTADAIGYVLSPKGVLAGEKVDIQMLYGSPGGGGGGGVQSVTGLDTDNTDPLNPIVNIAVDGVTITGDGTPGNPLVASGVGSVASLLEDAAPQLNQWQWDNGSGQTGTLILDNKFENAIHVAKNGDDTLALQTLYQPFSTKVPFLTINAAYAASNGSSTIVVWPGKYILPASISVDFTQSTHIHCMPGATIQNAIGTAISFTGSGTFNWTGDAIFQCHTFFFENATSDLVRLNVEGNYAFNDNLLSNQYFVNLKNMYIDIRLNELRSLGFFATSWRAGFIGIDLWTCTQQNLVYCDQPDSTFLDQYGPAKLVIGGRSAPKGRIEKSESAITNAGIFFEAQPYNYWDLTLELNFDVDWIDGTFILHGNGLIVLNGNVYPTKSNVLGNELPWYISNSPFESTPDQKPCFRHNGNSVNRKYKPDEESSWYLNNTAYFFQAGGKYYLNGFSQVLGASDNGVAGDFPVVSISDDSLGYPVYVYFEGVLKTGAPKNATIVTAPEVGPIKVTNSDLSPIYINFMDTVLVCGSEEKLVGPIWSSFLVSPVPIRVNHSLTMTNPINTSDFPNAYSFDRVSVDTLVDYEIEENGR